MFSVYEVDIQNSTKLSGEYIKKTLFVTFFMCAYVYILYNCMYPQKTRRPS